MRSTPTCYEHTVAFTVEIIIKHDGPMEIAHAEGAARETLDRHLASLQTRQLAAAALGDPYPPYILSARCKESAVASQPLPPSAVCPSCQSQLSLDSTQGLGPQSLVCWNAGCPTYRLKAVPSGCGKEPVKEADGTASLADVASALGLSLQAVGAAAEKMSISILKATLLASADAMIQAARELGLLKESSK